MRSLATTALLCSTILACGFELVGCTESPPDYGWSYSFERPIAKGIWAASTGGYYFAGEATPPGGTLPKSLLMKISAKGETEWNRFQTTLGARYAAVPDGGILILEQASPQLHLTKLDPTGSTVWERPITTQMMPLFCRRFIAMSDSGCMLTAVGPQSEFHYLRLTAQGDVAWDRCSLEEQDLTRVSALRPVADDGFIASTTGDNTLDAIRLAPDLSVRWRRHFVKSGWRPNSACYSDITPGGDFVFATTASRDEGTTILRLDAQGKLLGVVGHVCPYGWLRPIHNGGMASMCSDQHGNAVIVGIDGTATWVNGMPGWLGNGYIMQVSPSGHVNWSKMLTRPWPFLDMGGVTLTPDGNYITVSAQTEFRVIEVSQDGQVM